jgi:hypothetical protein
VTTPSRPKRASQAAPAAAAAPEKPTPAAKPTRTAKRAAPAKPATPAKPARNGDKPSRVETAPAAEAPAPRSAQVVSALAVSTQPVTLENGVAVQHGTPILPARHPNLGLAPANMKAGFSGAARRVRADKARIAARGLEEAVAADPSLRKRYDDPALRRLLRDGELLVERLAMSLGSDDVRWIAEYAEWIGPLYRRRHVPLRDLATLCAGIRAGLAGDLDEAELASADRALDAAQLVLRRNGRVAGDRHKRRAIFKWMYRGV